MSYFLRLQPIGHWCQTLFLVGHYSACFRCLPPPHLIEMIGIVIRLLRHLLMSRSLESSVLEEGNILYRMVDLEDQSLTPVLSSPTRFTIPARNSFGRPQNSTFLVLINSPTARIVTWKCCIPSVFLFPHFSNCSINEQCVCDVTCFTSVVQLSSSRHTLQWKLETDEGLPAQMIYHSSAHLTDVIMLQL